MQIGAGCVVASDFELFNGEDELIDSSQGGGPLIYLHGGGELLPKLEESLTGHLAGDSLSVKLTPAEAFGQPDPSLVDKVPRANFPGIEVIEPGMRFETEMEDGSAMVVVVTQVDDEWVTVDGNHELAGQHLRFELKVKEVRQATEEEIAHGHVHAQGECEH